MSKPVRRSIDASSVFSNDDFAEYDFVSEGQRSLESSIADLSLGEESNAHLQEPPASEAAQKTFSTPSLTAEDIQVYVQRATGLESKLQKTVRVYVDGLFDPFNAG
jgi:choline-phosphate cytidylyltransferase